MRRIVGQDLCVEQGDVHGRKGSCCTGISIQNLHLDHILARSVRITHCEGNRVGANNHAWTRQVRYLEGRPGGSQSDEARLRIDGDSDMVAFCISCPGQRVTIRLSNRCLHYFKGQVRSCDESRRFIDNDITKDGNLSNTFEGVPDCGAPDPHFVCDIISTVPLLNLMISIGC